MRFATLAAVAASLFSAASAVQYNVTVGPNNTNTYDPSSITGVVAGDVISFRFVSKSHSVTQSTFDQPCVARAGGVDSGFFPVDAAATSFPEWTIQIENASAPLWFFCARAPHCTAAGMVFAINPTAERTFQAFQATATGGAAGNTGTTTTGTNTTTTGTDGGAADPATTDSGALSLSAHKLTTMLVGIALVAGFSL